MNDACRLEHTPIAIIGVSAIFADAVNAEEFWTNIVLGKDNIREVPDSRWLIEDYYDTDPTAPDKTYCKTGGFLPEIDFNPLEFGLPPNILEVTDTSQLLALVAARDVLADAGYAKGSERFSDALRQKTGVLLGVGGGQKLITPLIARLQYPVWERALRASGVAEEDIPHIVDKMKKAYVGWNENSFPGLLGNVISGRITNRFDLGGINSVVDAACAASLSAVKMAISELVEGRADMMITGGVDTDNSPFMYMSFSKTPAFSKSDKITPFSEDADGMIIGEGIGMVVLKRLADAERDGDRIYATINGVGTSSDGRFKSVYAPRASGQALAMQRTYEDAGYAPQTVGLVEAHGTGTGAGDPTEFESMSMVFGPRNGQGQHIALGSVKSQIGHTKAAAGSAGLVKTALALYHQILPPTINVREPNSKFDMQNAPLYINTETRPWIKGKYPRRASLSAFGFGGINVHLTLQEYPRQKQEAYRMHQPYKAILISAPTPVLLEKRGKQVLEDLAGVQSRQAFYDLCQEPAIVDGHARLGFVCTDIQDCKEKLDTAISQLSREKAEWQHPKGIFYHPTGLDQKTHKVAAVFSGQGSQYIGMAKELLNAFPNMKEAVEAIDAHCENKGLPKLSPYIYPIPVFKEGERKVQQQELTKTQRAQPAIGGISMGMYETLERAGFTAHMCAGHSFGELTALWAAGMLSREAFIDLAISRGQAMSAREGQADTGTMVAVKATEKEVTQAISSVPEVKIANFNAPQQVVVAGSTSGIEKATVLMKQNGLSVIPLPVSAAFHTEKVEHAQKPFLSALARITFSKGHLPVYANSTAKTYPHDLDLAQKMLGEQLLQPVYFRQIIEQMYQDGARVFVEFGPKGILTNLIKATLQGKYYQAISLNANAKQDSDLQFRQAVVQMQVLGLPISNLDPYATAEAKPGAPQKLTVKLSGNNYVSEATQKAYREVMENGHTISQGEPRVIEKIVEVEKIIEVSPQSFLAEEASTDNDMDKHTLELLQSAIKSIQERQTQTLALVEKTIADQNAQTNQLLHLLQQGMDNPAPGNTASTPNVQPPSVQPAAKITPSAPSGPSPVASPPVKSTPSVDTTGLEQILLAVVSEKTGYPAEMLEMDMDMEADLGIDSIKRVEIFGAITQKYPNMGDVDPKELTEIRTLGGIVDHIAGKVDGNASNPVETKPKPVQAQQPGLQPQVQAQSQPVAVAPSPKSKANTAGLEALLMEVVSEKTGYPAEMLELDMDMEADLGIDSIKRVEIFGSLTQKYPSMSGIDPKELTEIRTLGGIVDFVSNRGISIPASNTSTAANTTATVSAPPAADSCIDVNKYKEVLLNVVSEKTGYPAEMLEMDMDLEADLGIDSIKRVEIFGAMTQNHPELGNIDPKELTELRTLGAIVEFLSQPKKKQSA